MTGNAIVPAPSEAQALSHKAVIMRVPLSCSIRQFSVLIAGLFAFSACMDSTPPSAPLTPGISLARSPGGNGPTVKSTDPDTATIDTTLSVRVLGSGYDPGSRANWAFKGVVSDKIVTNSTVFVSSTELIANITIARDANLGSHDVIVTTSSGKGGIGTELFVVTLQTMTLPTIDGRSTDAMAINDAGQVVGSIYDTDGRYAVRWTKEGGTWTIRKIALEATVAGSNALAINEQGTAVGSLNGVKGAVWRIDGSQTNLGQGQANAINNSDVIAGMIVPDGGGVRAAVWTPSGLGWTGRLLERLPGVTRVNCGREEGFGINDDNVIVGVVFDENCVQIAVQWRPAADGSNWLAPEALSPPGTLAKGVAQAITGSTIVGTAYPCAALAGCIRKAFRWTVGGAGAPLGALDARANGVNRAGDIAGSYVRKGGQMTGFVWSPITSAFVFLPTPGGVGHNWAWDINDASPRQAVGAIRISSGGQVATLWTIP